jgi:hypothetical protein
MEAVNALVEDRALMAHLMDLKWNNSNIKNLGVVVQQDRLGLAPLVFLLNASG